MTASVVTHDVESAPSTSRGRKHPAAWWAMSMVIVTESMIFAALISADLFVRAASTKWPQGGIARPELGPVSIFTVLLVGSSVPVWLAERAIGRGEVMRLRWYLGVAWAMAAVFLVYTVRDLARSEFSWRDNAYASLFTAIVGLHAVHVAVGLAMSAGVQAKAAAGRLAAERHLTVKIMAMYWHFVDAVWVVVLSVLYLSVSLR